MVGAGVSYCPCISSVGSGYAGREMLDLARLGPRSSSTTLAARRGNHRGTAVSAMSTTSLWDGLELELTRLR